MNVCVKSDGTEECRGGSGWVVARTERPIKIHSPFETESTEIIIESN